MMTVWLSFVKIELSDGVKEMKATLFLIRSFLERLILVIIVWIRVHCLPNSFESRDGDLRWQARRLECARCGGARNHPANLHCLTGAHPCQDQWQTPQTNLDLFSSPANCMPIAWQPSRNAPQRIKNFRGEARKLKQFIWSFMWKIKGTAPWKNVRCCLCWTDQRHNNRNEKRSGAESTVRHSNRGGRVGDVPSEQKVTEKEKRKINWKR